MKRYILAFLLLISGIAASAQEQPASDTLEKPNYWTKGMTTQVTFSQLSLTNWAAGGYGSVSLNTYINAYRDYQKDNVKWENQLQMGYGFIYSFDEVYKKSDDRLIFDSKFGYKAVDKLYMSAVFNATSQFANGYKGEDVVSSFAAPAYISLGLGIDYTPTKSMSINFAPLTGKVVIVKDPALRSLYGNAEDQFTRFELGAQLKVNNRISVQNFSVESALTLFSDYLNHPLNVKVNWDLNVNAQIAKYFSVSLRTNLIYDDNIKHIQATDKKGNIKLDENGNPIMVPGVQFREVFGIGFSYTFGSVRKK